MLLGLASLNKTNSSSGFNGNVHFHALCWVDSVIKVPRDTSAVFVISEYRYVVGDHTSLETMRLVGSNFNDSLTDKPTENGTALRHHQICSGWSTYLSKSSKIFILSTRGSVACFVLGSISLYKVLVIFFTS